MKSLYTTSIPVVPAERVPEVPVDVLQDVPDCVGELLFLGGLVGAAVGHHELGLVVKHLLEVGNVPAAVSGIAGEALTIIKEKQLHTGKPCDRFMNGYTIPYSKYFQW